MNWVLWRARKTRFDHFQRQLETLNDHPTSATRGVGMLGAFEIVRDKKTKAR
ncbi:MAG: hypothetical protein R3C58_00755 [Parvularculaceae bacterium]